MKGQRVFNDGVHRVRAFKAFRTSKDAIRFVNARFEKGLKIDNSRKVKYTPHPNDTRYVVNY